MIALPLILSVLGFCIAFYTFLVERKIKSTPRYQPACDINDWISCSKPMKSIYANIFFISNSILAMLFYLLIAGLAFKDMTFLLFVASLGACIVSAMLAYLLYFKIKSLCLLCTSLYLINIILLIVSIRAL